MKRSRRRGEIKDVRDGSTTSDNRCDRGIGLREILAFLEVSGVEILRAMGQEVESGHQQHGVDRQ